VYDVWQRGDARWILGSATAAKYARELEGASKVGELAGSELVGRRYRPLFPYFAATPNAFRVLAGDFVDTQEGTGIVHMAPGFGEDDQRICAANGIEVVVPVDQSGRFTAEVTDWAGTNVLAANRPIIAELKRRGVLVRHDTLVHSYPHCWRTDQPLIYRALSSWYVRVTAFRDRMVELNRTIRWIPEHVRDGQFGRWLEGARDWSISRNRFWGSPIPVWRSDDPAYPRIDVYGGLDELERDFGVRPRDLHRPTIDALTRPNPDDPTGRSTMRRVEEVFDCWFESGSMPFAQVHYPFENKEWFENHFPADFIVEYVSQTRGWFYTLMVLGTALFDRPPFENCICHGVVLDTEGRKLSKRLQNYPDPEGVFATHGSDALRWYLCSSQVLRGGDLEVDKEGRGIADVVRLVINPIWNAYAFFCLYANSDGVEGRVRTDQRGALDRYVLAKTRATVEDVQAALDAFDLPAACNAVRGFLDALNNWYIRRSRPRFWKAEHDADKRDAYDTLYTVLTVLCRAAAPLLPLVLDEIWHGLTGRTSVHLEDWPDVSELPSDPELVRAMDRVREVCSSALALREERRLRVRLPLPALSIAGADSARLEPFFDLIRDEVNVKDVRTSQRVEDLG
jgi:isoleucyl-tRNA synthetase